LPKASDQKSPRRFVVGIGVSKYDDPSLNLEKVPEDVEKVTSWFAKLKHARVLPELADSPKHYEIGTKLSDWLDKCEPDDVVVIYFAAHGEVEGGTAYIQGRDSPRQKLAGKAITGETLGSIIGQAKPHKVLVIVDACVAGNLGAAIQQAAVKVAGEDNTRDPYREFAHAVLCSTFGRDPAYDGAFAQVFMEVVSEERWTGSSDEWISVSTVLRNLNRELRERKVPQVAERTEWGTAPGDLIPNPNYASRQLGSLIADEELASHFDPSSRGVSRGEVGSYFTGRRKELERMVGWLSEQEARGKPYVVTGSPGSGKSALISRLVVLSDPQLRAQVPDLQQLPKSTVPAEKSISAVVWCHNKNLDQIVADLGQRLGVTAWTTNELLAALSGKPLTIVFDALDEAVDSLDEAVASEATRIAVGLIRPLAERPGVKVIVATRPHPARSKAEDVRSDLLAKLGVDSKHDDGCLRLDDVKNGASDMRAYVAARLMASAEPEKKTPYSDDSELAERVAGQIVTAAGRSFLVAAVTARSLAMRDRAVDPAKEELELPTEAGAALAGYIERLPDPKLALDILRPLAWAEGAGLPWGSLWAPLASALASAVSPEKPAAYDDRAVARVLDSASDLLVESMEDGEPVYRLFHEALAEHLRGDLASSVAHAAISTVIDRIVMETSFEHANPYALAYFAAHLHGARAGKRLYELVTDPLWERATRQAFGDSVSFLNDVDLAITRALWTPTALAGACTVYGRMMAVAPAIVIDVIAKGGHLQRAELMADNIEFAVDRCLAYSLLAPSFHEEGDTSAVQRCLTEAERAIAAIDATHSSMAWAWVADAAAKCGFRDVARRASESALKAVDELRAAKAWEFSNALFWAGKAAQSAGDSKSSEALLAMFTESIPKPGRNQELQAASVLGAKDALRVVLKEAIEGSRLTIVRDGNLALALADAGMNSELDELFDFVAKDGEPRGEPDAQKRWAWALAIAGLFDQALDHVGSIDDIEHRTRALGRVASVAAGVKNNEAIAAAKKAAKKLARSSEWRIKSLVASILYTLDDTREAMRLAEDVVREGVVPSQESSVAFRKPDEPAPDPVGAKARFTAMTRRMGKTGRQPLRTSIGALSDAQTVAEIEALARSGKLDEAEARVRQIRIPRFRWEAWRAIAKIAPRPLLWVLAMLEARLVGEPFVRATVAEVPRDRERVLEEVRSINTRWIEAGFVEQYESLRTSFRSSEERTSRMEDLMRLTARKPAKGAMPPIDLTWWTPGQVSALVKSGNAGQRVFALALMESEPRLAQFDLITFLIENSLSAFEQGHALKVASQFVGGLSATEREQLLAVLARERKRHITPGSDREALARKIERAAVRG
jgi:hypothetical protein